MNERVHRFRWPYATPCEVEGCGHPGTEHWRPYPEDSVYEGFGCMVADCLCDWYTPVGGWEAAMSTSEPTP